MSTGPEPIPTPAPEQPIPAETITTGVLVLATGLVVYLCYLVVEPFLTALAWALALAVIAHPVHRWLDRQTTYRSLCAGLTVVAIMLLLMIPAAFVTTSLVQQATQYAGVVQDGITSGRWEEALKANRYLGPLLKRLPEFSSLDRDKSEGAGQHDAVESADQQRALEEDASTAAEQVQVPAFRNQEEETSHFRMPSSGSLASAAGMVTSRLRGFLSGAGWIGMQVLITMMCLFFFLRDRHSVLDGVRGLMPLSESEADRIIRRINDTIHATVFGSLTVAFVQGCMGGLMFWMLGLPSPLFWGAVMGLLAVVPILGTFVIWAPTAAWLAMQGDWTRAGILVAWGALAIGLIDNLLYPFLVGNRMRFHTLLVFFSIVGGLAVFGAAGVILGPVLLAVADGLLQVWRHRIDRARRATT
ncbi:putative inner membrane protein [Caulifigura coniformis]|uniref:Putative inner membrane protein n=1 Tax=Caulifigura coniformis TaxID=2527983 RepID=A0A517SMS1_9PLAN|nr:AI-2E family transporter [Caulifigura coniformis]QDT57421.1 putative inner membrane protein [Caulifigura coniformis]